MHTFRGKKGSIFNYNSDFSGNIIIQDVNDCEVKVDGTDILEFVAFCYIQNKKIQKIEDATYEELLTI